MTARTPTLRHARAVALRHVLIPLLGLVSLTVIAAPADARGVTPTLGNSSSVGLNASFMPSHTFTDADVTTLSRRSNWIIASQTKITASLRDRMRAANTSLQFAAYDSVTGARPEEAAALPACQARTSTGAKLLSISYGTVLMDPGCIPWQAAVIDRCAATLATGWDRCYLDVMGPGEWNQLFYAEGDSMKRSAHPAIPLLDWQARKRSLLAAMVSATGRTAWVNCLGNGVSAVTAEVAKSGCTDPTLVQWAMAEGFGRGVSVYAAEKDLLLKSRVPVLAVCKQYATYDAVLEFRCLAMFGQYGDNDMVETLMLDKDVTIPLSPAAAGLVRLGRPTGPPVLDPTSRILVRPFTCGYLIIRESATVAFNGGWTVPGTATYTTWNNATFRGGQKVLASGWNGNGLIRNGCVA